MLQIIRHALITNLALLAISTTFYVLVAVAIPTTKSSQVTTKSFMVLR